MSTAYDKTKNHERIWLPIHQLEPNPDNPNKMSPRAFDLLVDNIESKGMTEDIEVRRIGKDQYRIIGGHHRWGACEYLGWKEVPCIVNTDPDMTDEVENFQVVRMNMIHGKLDPTKFMAMYQKVSEKYSDEILAESFGFADEAEFAKLIKQTANTLPPELKSKFKEAAAEIKTVEDLATVLNELLFTYGNTVAYGYMIFDFNGKESVWVRMNPKDKVAAMKVGDLCRANSRMMDSVVSALFQLTQEEGDLGDSVRAHLLDVTHPEEIDLSATWPTQDQLN